MHPNEAYSLACVLGLHVSYWEHRDTVHVNASACWFNTYGFETAKATFGVQKQQPRFTLM